MEIKDTIENGESEVQIATIGEVIGTGADGEPVVQNLTEESLQKLAERHKDDELLVDADHESEMGGKTEAKGWLSSLKFIPGVGLFGKIRWTDIGRKLIENRVFRWLSPSWYLNKETKEPVQMTSVALTNKPSQAGRIEPIVNSAPVSNDFINKSNMEELEMTITKEELVSLIKETVVAMNSVPKTETPVVNEEPKKECEETTEEKVENECEKEPVETKTEVVKNEDAEQVSDDDVTEEVKEEVKEEKNAEQVSKEDEPETEDEEEVIKLESLNSQPKTEGIDIVKNSVSTTQPSEPQFTGIKIIRII